MKTRKSSKHITPEQWKQIALQYSNGRPVKEILSEYNIGSATLLFKLRRMGVQIHKVGHGSKKYEINEHYFDEIDTEEKAYYLGLLGSDGHTIGDRFFSVGLSGEDDAALLIRFKNSLEYTGPILSKQPKYKGSKRHYTLSVTSETLTKNLIKNGIVNRKSLTYEFNDLLRRDLIRHYVRGYFDGDGSVSIKKDGTICASIISSKAFIEKAADYIEKEIGIKVFVEYFKPPRNPSSACLKINGNFASFAFLSWMYKDTSIFLPRKHAKYVIAKEIVGDKLRHPEKCYNNLRSAGVLKNMQICAQMLEIPFDPNACLGLSFNMDEQKEILEMYATGLGIKGVASVKNCSTKAIRNVLERNNIHIRNPSEQSNFK